MLRELVCVTVTVMYVVANLCMGVVPILRGLVPRLCRLLRIQPDIRAMSYKSMLVEDELEARQDTIYCTSTARVLGDVSSQLASPAPRLDAHKPL